MSTPQITVGRVTLEAQGEDFTDAGPGSLWGVDRSTGNAVFITLETSLIGREQYTPWSAALWVGWEDSTRAPRDFGVPRFATRAAALAAMRNRVPETDGS